MKTQIRMTIAAILVTATLSRAVAAGLDFNPITKLIGDVAEKQRKAAEDAVDKLEARQTRYDFWIAGLIGTTFLGALGTIKARRHWQLKRFQVAQLDYVVMVRCCDRCVEKRCRTLWCVSATLVEV